MGKTMIVKSDQAERVQAPWGDLTWYASGKLGNATELTAGKCVIKPGMSNPKHRHPNCTEVLVVLKGKIKHTTENGDREMNEGDTIRVEQDFPHQASNIGETNAELFIVFTSADRKVVGE